MPTGDCGRFVELHTQFINQKNHRQKCNAKGSDATHTTPALQIRAIYKVTIYGYLDYLRENGRVVVTQDLLPVRRQVLQEGIEIGYH